MAEVKKRVNGLKVLLATDACLERGGITLFMLQWIRGIIEADPNCSIHVYFREHIEDEEIASQYRNMGVCIHTGNIPSKVSFKNTAARRKIAGDIKGIFSKGHFDVMHVNSGIFGFTVDLLTEAKRANVPIRIAHSHGAYSETRIDKVIHFFLRLRIHNLVTAYAGCSKKAGLYMFGDKGINSPIWHNIPNAIQADKFTYDDKKRKEYRMSLHVQDDELLLGAIGHLYAGKNHVFLIDVLKELREKEIQAKLIIIGQGDQEESLRAKALHDGVQEYVILYGVSEDVAGWLSAMDIFLMPSKSEGLGISAIEAQANGLPCILSDRFPEETVVRRNVWCLPIDCGTEVWADKIQEIANESISDRSSGVKDIASAGFDQHDTSKYVRLLYNI